MLQSLYPWRKNCWCPVYLLGRSQSYSGYCEKRKFMNLPGIKSWSSSLY